MVITAASVSQLGQHPLQRALDRLRLQANQAAGGPLEVQHARAAGVARGGTPRAALDLLDHGLGRAAREGTCGTFE